MDEADVFLEERTMADIHRNSLVSSKSKWLLMYYDISLTQWKFSFAY